VSPSPNRLLTLASLLAISAPARAQSASFAEPPEGPRRVVVASDDPEPPPRRDADADPPTGAVRVVAGGVARMAEGTTRAGVYAALDLGRRTAGARLYGAWVRVGYDDPLAQGGAELTLTLPITHVLVASTGVGGGVARVGRVSGGARVPGGATLGVGTLRGGLDLRLPITDVDARVGVAAIGTMPVMRGEGAPAADPWLLGAATITVGW